LLYEILTLIPSGKIKRATASIFAKWVLEGRRRNSETVIQGMLHYEQISCTKDGILRDSSFFDCPDLKCDLEESGDSGCEIGCESEEASEYMKFNR
jgi:hypothetical protein